jgi:hypothetical protein
VSVRSTARPYRERNRAPGHPIPRPRR